jgi:pimeloyl-ACP methyl ester carboxylesterase
VTAVATAQTQTQTQTPDGAIPYRFYEANGIPVHYVEYGTGVPVVALHGWAVDHHYMEAVLEPVFTAHPGYRRIYVDSPGMGRTPAPEQIDSTADMLEVILAFIDGVIGDEPFLLAGHSHGGYLARAVVNRRPGQVLGLALINPMGHGGKLDGGAELPAHVVLHRSGDLDGILEPALEAEYPGYLVIQTPETLRLFAEREGPGIAAADQAALERIYKDFFLADSPESGEPFTKPALILTGRQDSFTGYAAGWGWLPHYPRASYVVLDSAGHGLPHEQVGLTTALLGEWLGRVAWDGTADRCRPG